VSTPFAACSRQPQHERLRRIRSARPGVPWARSRVLVLPSTSSGRSGSHDTRQTS
jgi:hypothetical protein